MPKQLLSQKSKAVFYTILAGALWGTSFPIIKVGLAYTDPFAFLFWRFLVSSVSLVAVMLLLRRLSFKMADTRLLVFLGIANAAGYLLQYVGMNYTTAAKAALFINLSAMWVALLSPKLLGERFSRTKIFGVLFGLVGIVFVSTNLDFQSLMGGQIIGDVMLVVSGVAWAIFMVYNKRLLEQLHLGDVPVYDLGARIHDAFDPSIFVLGRRKIFRFKLVRLASGFLHSYRMLGHSVLSLARGAQTSIGFNIHRPASIRNRDCGGLVYSRAKRTHHSLLNNRRFLYRDSNCTCFPIIFQWLALMKMWGKLVCGLWLTLLFS